MLFNTDVGREFAGRSCEQPARFTIELFHFFDLVEFPSVFEPRVEWAIKTEEHVPAFDGKCLDSGALLAVLLWHQ
jgi:hypothetical protein